MILMVKTFPELHPSDDAFSRQWLAEGRVVYYKVSSPSPSVIRQWAATAIETLRQWPSEQPYLAIHDLSAPGASLTFSRQLDYNIGMVGITEEGESEVQTLIAQRPNSSSRLAIVISQKYSGHIVQVLSMRRLMASPHEVKVMFGVQVALDWLLS